MNLAEKHLLVVDDNAVNNEVILDPEAAQRYFYARPLPADAFATWCKHWQPLFSITHMETANGS